MPAKQGINPFAAWHTSEPWRWARVPAKQGISPFAACHTIRALAVGASPLYGWALIHPLHGILPGVGGGSKPPPYGWAFSPSAA